MLGAFNQLLQPGVEGWLVTGEETHREGTRDLGPSAPEIDQNVQTSPKIYPKYHKIIQNYPKNYPNLMKSDEI